MNDYQFGNFMYELRSAKGLSQSELGEMLGVTNKAVSKWETGAARPNTKLLPKLAEILGVSVEELMLGKRIDKSDEAMVSESAEFKEFLAERKKRYAFCFSIFATLVLVVPFLYFYFVSDVLPSISNNNALLILSLSAFGLLSIAVALTIVYKSNIDAIPVKLQDAFTEKQCATLKKAISMTGFAGIAVLLLRILFDIDLKNHFFEELTAQNIRWILAALMFLLFGGMLFCIFYLRYLKRATPTVVSGAELSAGLERKAKRDNRWIATVIALTVVVSATVLKSLGNNGALEMEVSTLNAITTAQKIGWLVTIVIALKSFWK